MFNGPEGEHGVDVLVNPVENLTGNRSTVGGRLLGEARRRQAPVVNEVVPHVLEVGLQRGDADPFRRPLHGVEEPKPAFTLDGLFRRRMTCSAVVALR